jgi:DNA-binding NtrC family response regulator
MAEILIVDDEIGVRELLTEVLQDEGHSVILAANGAEAREQKKRPSIEVILLDIWMPDTDGITLLKEWMSTGFQVPVIVMSGHATIDTAVEATKMGAYDYLEKPITLSKLTNTIKNATEKNASEKVPISSIINSQDDQNASGVYQKNLAVTDKRIIAKKVGPQKLQLQKLVVTEDEQASKEFSALAEAKKELSMINLDSPLREARDSFERIYLSYQLAKLQGSMTRLAERSGLERTHLYRKIRQLGMELQRGVLKKNNQ